MNEFEYPDYRRVQPEIVVNSYLPIEGQQRREKTFWDWLFSREPSKLYLVGWLETNDKLGFLRPFDVIFVGISPTDPNGIELYIKKLTSHNEEVRTYEVSSTKPVNSLSFLRGKNVYKLYSTHPIL